MISPEDLNGFINVLPNAVLYIAPGYITLAMYHASKDGKVTDHIITAIKSMFLSYIYVSTADLFTHITKFSDSAETLIRILLIGGLALLFGILANTIFLQDIIKKVTSKIYKTTPYTDLMDDIKSISRNGDKIWMTVYLDKENKMFEGYLIRDRMNPQFKQYIILDCYCKYIRSDSNNIYMPVEEEDHCEKPNKHNYGVVIELDRISHIEFYITELACKDNKISLDVEGCLKMDDYNSIEQFLYYGYSNLSFFKKRTEDIKNLFKHCVISEPAIEDVVDVLSTNFDQHGKSFYKSLFNYLSEKKRLYDSTVVVGLMIAIAGFFLNTEVLKIIDKVPNLSMGVLVFLVIVWIITARKNYVDTIKYRIILESIDRKICSIKENQNDTPCNTK